MPAACLKERPKDVVQLLLYSALSELSVRKVRQVHLIHFRNHALELVLSIETVNCDAASGADSEASCPAYAK